MHKHNYCYLFIFCFLIHTLFSAYSPKQHQVDRLPHALAKEVPRQNAEPNKSDTGCHHLGLIQDLFFGIIEVSQECSHLGQSSFHFLIHFYKHLGRFLPKAQVKLAFNALSIHSSEKPTGIYASCASLLPRYYTFLFRLTPF